MGRLGGNPTRCFRAIGFYGQTGSAGAETPNQSDGAAEVRFHGVLAPNSRYRDRVTPVSSGKVKKPAAEAEADGRQEPDLTASKRKGMCCTLKGIKTATVTL